MSATVKAGVKGSVDSRQPDLSIRLLGQLSVLRGGTPVPVPNSRKVRALVAYLAMSTRPQAREHLCELLWPRPDDPRSVLRTSLSKARTVLDAPERVRVLDDGSALWLNLRGVDVDALEVDTSVQGGLERRTLSQLMTLLARFNGEFLEGLEIDQCPAFTAWLVAQRRRFRAAQLALLEALARCVPAGAPETLELLGRWLQLAPFDRQAHTMLLVELARRGAWHEGEAQLSAAVRSFEAEGLDAGFLVHAWQRGHAYVEPVPATPLEVSAPETPAAVSMPATPLVDVAPAMPYVDLAPAMPLAVSELSTPRRAAIAVMPFDAQTSSAEGPGGVADALVYDMISQLAKLRTLFVIAQGTVFALARRNIGPEEAGRLLNVDYVVAGRVRLAAGRLLVSVELVEARSARVVWTDVFDQPMEQTFAVLDAIGQRIVALLASEIEIAERNLALLKPPDSLDAWEAYHCGLWHMYRFRREGNEQARGFFEQALRLDPTFSRAHAGVSFTHFQNVFQGWGDGQAELACAIKTAGQSLTADDQDPMAHWAMGRALWLAGETRSSLAELDTAVSLSPNFAQGHYMRAFVNANSGDPEQAISVAELANKLNPFDPMVFGTYISQAIALARLGRYDEAAERAVKAATRPNAFAHVHAVAALCLVLAQRLPEARAFAAVVQRMAPGYDRNDIQAAGRFTEDASALFNRAAEQLGW